MPLKLKDLKQHAEVLLKATPGNMKALINQYAKCDAEITVPIILHFLRDKIQPLYENTTSIKAIEAAVDVFKKADDYQSMNLISLATKLSEVKDLLSVGLENLIEQVKTIELRKEDEVLWRIIYICLEAIHTRVLNLLTSTVKGESIKEKDGSYKRIDGTDAIFYRVTHLTKYDIALYYHKTAEIILPKMQAIAALNAVQVFSEDEATVTYSVRVPRNQAERFREICSAFANNPDAVAVRSANQLTDDEIHACWGELALVEDSVPNIQIMKLQSLYSQYGLTQAQQGALQQLGSQMTAQSKSYLNSVSYFSPQLIFGKVHAETANRLIATAESAVATPDAFLKCLFDAREELISENSRELIQKIENILLEVYGCLLTNVQYMLKEKNPDPVRRFE